MNAPVIALDRLLDERRVWKGQPQSQPSGRQPSGHSHLDAALPSGGWPEAALSEILLPRPGLGELRLLWPTLARLSQAGERLALIAPPFLPYAPAWQVAGIELPCLEIVRANEADALWAAEQCSTWWSALSWPSASAACWWARG